MSYSYPNRPPKPDMVRPIVKQCCARCRRGIKGFGELPCGFDKACGCHDGETRAEQFLAKRAVLREES